MKNTKSSFRGVQREYNSLVAAWGREIANEIMVKRARSAGSSIPNKATKKGKKKINILDAHWLRAGGSFENGKKR